MKNVESVKHSLEILRTISVPRVLLLILPLLIILATVVYLFIRDQTTPVVKDQPVLVPPPPEVNLDHIRQLLPQDSIRSIDDPQFVPASDGTVFMEPDEKVIGLVINGDARAYPIPILSNHEIVNDIVGDEPIAITWCPLCFSALVFSRNVEDQEQPLTFGVSGSLLYDTLVMYDRQTESTWSQLYGAALDGPMADSRLAFFPSLLTEWSAWLEQHPESQVLSKPLTCAQFQCGSYSTNPRGSYDVDPYESYYNTHDEGVFERQIPRDELSGPSHPKEQVLGIRIAGRARAYPYRVLQDQSLVNDVVNGRPILVWFDPDTQTGTAYLREVNGQTLTFQTDPLDPQILIDQENGGRWQATTGTALNGPHRGERLPPLVVTPAFSFGWYDYFPSSETYEPG
ncbi:MAG: DUF3179 domain-containing protein [Chloroflexota bacterium]